ncbi:MAG: mRNA binding protein puf3 [Vezdaea aestivalis]|nr:MAG: mRNA binding protein puf3 [Vezdaea aestivalis]
MNSTAAASANGNHQASMAGHFEDYNNNSGRVSGDGSRPSQTSGFGSSFGQSGGAWNKNSIWSGNGGFGINNGGDVYNNSNLNTYESSQGPGSLASSSQPDPWRGQANPWNKSNTKPSPGSDLRSAAVGGSSQPVGNAPLDTNGQIEPGSHFGSTFANNPSTSGPFPRKPQLDPTSGSFVWGNRLNFASFDNSRNSPFGNPNLNSNNSYTSSPLESDPGQFGRYNVVNEISRNGSSVASRSGSIPPLRSNGNQSPRDGYGSQSGMTLPPLSSLHSYGSVGGNRSLHSAHNSGVSSQTFTGRPESAGFDQAGAQMTNNFAAMNMDNGSRQSQASYSRGYLVPDSRHQGTGRNGRFGSHIPSHGNGVASFAPEAGYVDRSSSSFAGDNQRRFNMNSQLGQNQMRIYQSRQYSAGGTPPTTGDSIGAQSRGSTSSGPSHTGSQIAPANNMVALDGKLRRLQQEQQDQQVFYAPSNPLLLRNEQFRSPLQQPPYGYNFQDSLSYPNFVKLPIPRGPQMPPRGPARDQEGTNCIMSPLMQDFKSNNKTSKRYDLKDLYDHVVEFSGDQHGSRFIQQKLETANSDEKEQVFREIKPNALQLMTDVFGNYVIQKFFEHGNQNQKSSLAEQMKGHVQSLSLQMYGCRVVQKALEHILLDQQILFVKELQANVMKSIQDQNGNHVIQKAIERVPQEHIQFVIEAVSGKVHPLAIHNYGCRVVQRLLEHTDEATQQSLLKELHACTYNLVLDPYGNYVVQHILSNGKPEDRAKVIDVVATNVIAFSKNKCGSNVVERCMNTATKEQLSNILDSIVGPKADKANSLSLMKDQFGNYVIQSILHILKGNQLEDFVEVIHTHLASLKKLNYGNGKQIAAKIEKVISTLDIPRNHTPPPEASAEPTPPLLSSETRSPESSSHPSTTNSTIDGPIAASSKDSSHTEIRLVAIS